MKKKDASQKRVNVEKMEKPVIPVFFSGSTPSPLLSIRRFHSEVLPETAAGSPVAKHPSDIAITPAFFLPSHVFSESSTSSLYTRSQQKSSSSETSPYELRRSPLQIASSYLREESLGPLALGDTVEDIDEFRAKELFPMYLFIFNFSFGDERTRKKCSADFFNSTTIVDPRISAPVKQYFYKVILQALNPIKAKMLLGHSAEKEQHPHLAEILRYLKEEMPSTEGICVESYIRAIANGHPPGEFPYASVEQEKFDFLLFALQESYEFFEYILTVNEALQKEGATPILNIREWLYDELNSQFNLSKDKEVFTKISSGISSDDEDIAQQASKLKITHQDLLKALYQHLKQLLKKDKSIPASAVKTLFLLVYVTSFKLIHENAEEELNLLCDNLLQTPTGLGFLCAEKDNMEKWLNLLGEKRSSVLFQKILSTLHYMNTKQVLALLDSVVMGILCTDKQLMIISNQNGLLVEALRQKVWKSFSFEALTDSPEIKRAFLSNEFAISSGEKTVNRLTSRPLLSRFQVDSYYSTTSGMHISALKDKWLAAYKIIYSLVLFHWLPSDTDLSNISRLKENWVNRMLKKLSANIPYDYNAYDAQHYVIAELPVEMSAALHGQEEALQTYQEQIKIMTDYYQHILACHKAQNIRLAQPYPTLDGYISFIELVKALAADKELNDTEVKIEVCARNLSGWFKEVIVVNYSEEAIFFGLTKRGAGAEEVLYLSTEYTQLFLELLKSAMPQKLSISWFAQEHGIVLNERKAKNAIKKLLRTITGKKQVDSAEITSPLVTIIRDATTAAAMPRVEKMRATPYPLSSPSGPSNKF